MAEINYTASTPKKSYTRRIGDNGFLGADFSTAPIFASDRRFRDLKNVWKDYKSGSGVAIETVPGFRELQKHNLETNDPDINGIFRFSVSFQQGDTLYEVYPSNPNFYNGEWIGIHHGQELAFIKMPYDDYTDVGLAFTKITGEKNKSFTPWYMEEPLPIYFRGGTFNALPNAPSIAFQAENTVILFCSGRVFQIRPSKTTEVEYSFDGDDCYCGFYIEDGYPTPRTVSPTFAYVPTTFIDGVPYEQKNMLTVVSKERYTVEVDEVSDSVFEVGTNVYLHEIVPEESLDWVSIRKVVLDGHTLTGRVDVGSYTSGYMIHEDSNHNIDRLYVWYKYGSYPGYDTVTVEVEYAANPQHFVSYKQYDEYKNQNNFFEGNPSYASSAINAITGCTICATFDERIFLAGNPNLPNTIFYSQRDLTGYNNPTYFGVLNYNNLGTSNAPIKAMIPSASTLCVLKDDSATDPTLYFLTGLSTEQDLVPRIYTVESGLPGIGCKGAACNFLDDIVFMSRNGVIGIDKQAVNLERTLGDRSALINGKLLQEDVTQAVFAEAEGYLWCLFKNNGHVYLADSRAYTQGAGYEWYFIDSVGSWSGDADAYFYSDNYVFANGTLVDGKQIAEVEDKTYASGKAQTEDGDPIYYTAGTIYKVVARGTADEQASTTGKITVYLDYTRSSVYDENHNWYNVSWTPDTSGAYIELLPTGETVGGVPTYYQIIPTGEKVGGTFHPATCMVASNDRVFFGTEDGVLLTFNNDKRGARAVSEDETEPNRYPFLLRPEWYTFCGHRIESFVETSDDDGGIGNLTKDTVRRSAVVDMKAMLGSKYRITTYTDRDGWKNDNAATGAMNDASQTMLDAVNFSGDEHINVQIRERSRKWVHKRYRIESNGFRSPFGLYRITYNFEINGRIK